MQLFFYLFQHISSRISPNTDHPSSKTPPFTRKINDDMFHGWSLYSWEHQYLPSLEKLLDLPSVKQLDQRTQLVWLSRWYAFHLRISLEIWSLWCFIWSLWWCNYVTQEKLEKMQTTYMKRLKKRIEFDYESRLIFVKRKKYTQKPIHVNQQLFDELEKMTRSCKMVYFNLKKWNQSTATVSERHFPLNINTQLTEGQN